MGEPVVSPRFPWLTSDHFLWDAHTFDTECGPNFWIFRLKRLRDGVRWGVKITTENPEFDRDKLRKIMRKHLMIGYNSLSYDSAMVWLAIQGSTIEQLKKANDRIIKGRLQYWQVEKALDVYIPAFNHIDLFEPNPSVKDGLKKLAGRLHARRMQDLPYDPDQVLTQEEIDLTENYCDNDVDNTEALLVRLVEPLQLRIGMGEQYEADFRSKSDAQMGEGIIKSQVEKAIGGRVYKAEIPAGTSFRYQVPEWMHFETPMMQEVLATIAETDIFIDADGKVQFPKPFEKFDIRFGDTSYKLGIGGLHSQESNRAVFSDAERILIDADVASQYPSIIMKLGLFPKALGKPFLPVYRSLMERRLAAKQAKDKTTDKGLKISINGAYGKLGSPYSVLFAPHLMIAVTLTGQLSLLMLIERAEAAGIPVVSGNTDGVVFHCPRHLFNGFVPDKDGNDSDRLNPSPIQDIIEWWEQVTSFKLEFAEYEAIYNQSVNCYMALKPGGKFKRKGPIANHWSEKLPWGDKNTDFDPEREGLKKNPQMTIIADAVLGFLLHGIPVEQTIRGCRDIREFVTVIECGGGGTWRDGYLGKVVRFYWSTDGDPIYKLKAHPKTGNRPKVPKTDGCRPMMELVDDLPADVDYDRYILAAHDMLTDIGFVAQASVAPLEDLYRCALEFN
jgi:hypothetical protein